MCVCVCPDSYCKFKAQLHQIFPMIIDTKHLCFALQKASKKHSHIQSHNLLCTLLCTSASLQTLSQTKLVEFTSLTDLCEALGSQRGTYYALYSPEVTHSDSRYSEHSAR